MRVELGEKADEPFNPWPTGRGGPSSRSRERRQEELERKRIPSLARSLRGSGGRNGGGCVLGGRKKEKRG